MNDPQICKYKNRNVKETDDTTAKYFSDKWGITIAPKGTIADIIKGKETLPVVKENVANAGKSAAKLGLSYVIFNEY